MKERSIHSQLSVVTDDQAAVVAQPSKGTLYFPSFPITTECSAVVYQIAGSIAPVGDNQPNTLRLQPQAQRIAVVTTIGNQTLGLLWSTAAKKSDGCQGRFGKAYIRWRGTGQLASQRNTLAVDHHHPLRALATLGFADSVAPFLAGAKLPSRKLSRQSKRPRWSNSDKNARQIRSHTPCWSQRCKRFQQTLGLTPISLGKSRQRAPVLSTQRIPSNTTRLLLAGRPRRRRLSLGKSGWIFYHCVSESNGSGMTSFSQKALPGTRVKCFQYASYKF